MNKKDYYQSISEIKATENFKKRTIHIMRQTEANAHTNPNNYSASFPHKPYMVRRKSSIIKLALICAVSLILIFSTLVYAGVFDFGKIYKIVFGDDYETVLPYIQPITDMSENDTPKDSESIIADDNDIEINAESIFDGIVVRGISAINDENTLRIFATVTDTTQNRLNEDTKFDNWGLDQGHGGNISVIDYDSETKTATLLITSLGEHNPGNATLNIYGFTNGRKFYEGINENSLNLYEVLKHHTPNTIPQDDVWVNGGAFQSTEGKSLARQSDLLKPDEMDVKFDNIAWCSVSNIGFVDGCLHIQIKSISNNENDLASINLGNDESDIFYNGHLNLRYTGLENRSKHYQDGYTQYKEMIYEGISSPEQLKDLTVTIDYLEQGITTDCHWEISVNIPEKAVIEANIFSEIIINGKSVRADSISISPLGITIQLPENIASEYNHNDSAHAVYDDGTVIDLPQTAIHGYENQSALVFSGQTVEIERVRSIVINGEAVNIVPLLSVSE